MISFGSKTHYSSIPPYNPGNRQKLLFRRLAILGSAPILLEGNTAKDDFLHILDKKLKTNVPEGKIFNWKSERRFVNKVGDIIMKYPPEIAREQLIAFIGRVAKNLK